jgi:hypothetical protein
MTTRVTNHEKKPTGSLFPGRAVDIQIVQSSDSAVISCLQAVLIGRLWKLVSQLKSLARGEREATARLIGHMAELDARGLYRAAGFSSLFTYCCEVLRLSEPGLQPHRGGEGGAEFPVILPMLGEGSLSLATARLLASHLTAENLPHL